MLDFSKSPTPKSSCLLGIHVSRALESRTPLLLRLQLEGRETGVGLVQPPQRQMWPSLALLARLWPVFEHELYCSREETPFPFSYSDPLVRAWYILGEEQLVLNGVRAEDPSPWVCLCTLLICSDQFSQPVIKSCFQMEYAKK